MTTDLKTYDKSYQKGEGIDGCVSVCVCIRAESSLQIACIKLRTVLSRAKCENGALTKIVFFVAGRKGVIDGEREKMNRSLRRT